MCAKNPIDCFYVQNKKTTQDMLRPTQIFLRQGLMQPRARPFCEAPQNAGGGGAVVAENV